MNLSSRWAIDSHEKSDLTNKKREELKSKFLPFLSGIAGNRTRVQTSNQWAFYTFIFRLVFRYRARPETATRYLALLVSTAPQSKRPSRFIFTVPLDGTPQTRAFQENSASLPCRDVD